MLHLVVFDVPWHSEAISVMAGEAKIHTSFSLIGQVTLSLLPKQNESHMMLPSAKTGTWSGPRRAALLSYGII